MKISIKHFDGKYPSFNVAISSAEGRDPFLEIKGCKIASGSKGDFISWPATKNQATGKYWNHVYASEAFNAAVMAEARKGAPIVEDKSDMPFDDDGPPF